MSTLMEQAFVAAGFKPSKPRKVRPQKVIKCRKCGSDMVRAEGTNIVVCLNDVEIKTEEGEVREIPCGNRIIFSNSK